jgi:hypothetical protein
VVAAVTSEEYERWLMRHPGAVTADMRALLDLLREHPDVRVYIPARPTERWLLEWGPPDKGGCVSRMELRELLAEARRRLEGTVAT